MGMAGRIVTIMLWCMHPSVPLGPSVMSRWAPGMSVLSMVGKTVILHCLMQCLVLQPPAEAGPFLPG